MCSAQVKSVFHAQAGNLFRKLRPSLSFFFVLFVPFVVRIFSVAANGCSVFSAVKPTPYIAINSFSSFAAFAAKSASGRPLALTMSSAVR